jgi:tetratricopeptide (TPR) repeat protein
VHQFGVRDVQRLLHLPRSTIRTLVTAGFVSPVRGPRNAWLFSFQDLIVLRTAQALAAARVPPRRIARAMKALRRHLPAAMPLSGLSIGADADRVVVREGTGRWQADSGQYLLAFEGSPADGSLSVLERPAPAPVPAAPDVDEHINHGCQLHEAGLFAEAERAYREGIERHGDEPLLFYNLGVLLEDMGRSAEAIQAYEAAVHLDSTLADGHYNLALLYETLGKPREAIRHMAHYRRLMKGK